MEADHHGTTWLAIDSLLSDDTPLYRYMSFAEFVSFVESEKIHLTNINTWDDPWEAATEKLPSLRDDGRLEYPLWSFHEDLYAQSWSLVGESDAMWRIYC